MSSLRERPFGLRARIVGVVLFTAVATLIAAAIALLGPLEQSLRHAEQKTLIEKLGNRPAAVVAPFAAIPLARVATSPAASDRLFDQQARVAGRVGEGLVNVVPAVDPTTPLLRRTTTPGDSYGDVAVALRRGHEYSSFATIGGREYARAAIPFRGVDGAEYVLTVRKDIAEIPVVVTVVRQAFLDGALVGLGLTLILGIPLSARLVRRLRRLRQAALEIAHEGPVVDVPVDRARDEVGDLARTLATMQRLIRRQEEARRAFVATASHELRTPLTSLDGMLELLDEDLGDEHPDLEDARALLGRARAQSRRLGRLAGDLLDLSRIDAQVQLRSEPVELGELSRAVLAEFDLGPERHDVRSSLEDGVGGVWALGDPGSIAQILRILLDNGLRVSPPGTEVKVALHREPTISITVSDHGPGVHPDDRDSIFERFQRGRNTAGQGGFGLGLAIGRELAQRMGGELTLQDRPGPGATFSLVLPAARAPEQDPLAVA